LDAWALLSAAAVVLLISLSSAATYLAVRSGADPSSDSPSLGVVTVDGGGPELPGDDAAVAIVSAYEPVFAELEGILHEGQGRLRPETMATLAENLQILNAAIREVQEALAADPGHPGMLRSLDGIYEAKLGFLRQAVSLTRGA
jgi:hypothetical protein